MKVWHEIVLPPHPWLKTWKVKPLRIFTFLMYFSTSTGNPNKERSNYFQRATINPVLIKENKNSAHVLHFLCCNCTKFNTTQDFQYKVFWRMKTQDKVISFLFLDLNSFLKRLQWEFTATWQIDWVRITVAIKIVTMHICFISEVIVTTTMVATLTP